MVPNIAATSPDAAPSGLTGLIEKHAWPSVLTHLKSNPSHAAVPRSGSGCLPLHDACVNQAPPGVIKALLGAHPAAAKTKAGEPGYLPIHYIFCSGANPVAVSALIAANPSGVRIRDDSDGMLPLHLACKWGATEDALNAILTAHPEGVYVRDFKGKFPIDYAKSSKTGSKMVLLTALDRASVYCTVSKNATMRLTEEFEAKMRQTEEAHASEIAKLKAGFKDERTRAFNLEGQLRAELKKERDTLLEMRDRTDPLENLLTEEKAKTANAEEATKACMVKIQKLTDELVAEKDKAKVEEDGLRSKLADVQLKDMDQVEEMEDLQSKIDAYEKTKKSSEAKLSKLEESLKDTQKDLSETKDSHEADKEVITRLSNDLTEEKRLNAANIQQIQNLNNSLNSLKMLMQNEMDQQELIKDTLEMRGKELRSALEGYNALAEHAAKHREKLMIATSEVTAIGNLAVVKGND